MAPEDRPLSISTSSHLTPDEVARHTFGTVRRGFDPDEVRAYLESVAAGLRHWAEREHELREHLADAEHLAAHPVLDEPTLTSALGAETARVLHSAHEVANEAMARAEADSTALLTEAREEAERSRAETETRLAEQSAEVEERLTVRVAETETAVEELRARTSRQVAEQIDTARADAGDLLAQAREECRGMVEEAQAARARVLADLSRRKKVLHAQIDQLRAGRQRLAETIDDVRQSVDAIAADLFAAEDNARLAAEAAGREAVGRYEDDGGGEPVGAVALEVPAVALELPEDGDVELPENGTEADDPVPEPRPADELVEVSRATEPAGGEPAGDEPAADETAEPEPEPVAGAGAGATGRPADGVEAGARGSEEGDTGPDSRPDGAPGQEEDVDALFAKIRAAREVPAADDVEPAGPGPADVAETGAAAAATGAGAADEPDADVAEDEPDGPPESRHPLAVRRDELVDPLVVKLSRRLKRTLQDSQNDLLDRLRSQRSTWSSDLLPDVKEQVDVFSTAALPTLEAAAAAGVAFSGATGRSGPKGDVLAGIAAELAEAVVSPLRRRLSVDDGLDGADESALAEHVGSAFREWKGERIERVAGDHVIAAFSAGTIAALSGRKGAQIEWLAVSHDGDDPCPDCEDNGLNGSQKVGQDFPTGHRHPPAHTGCRCLLAPAAT